MSPSSDTPSSPVPTPSPTPSPSPRSAPGGHTSDLVELCIRLDQAQAAVGKRFDRSLGGWHGVSFADFVLLTHLERAPGRRMRRIDLAEAVGMSASGVTRALAPLERIGLLTREVNPRDARVSFAVLTDAGLEVVTDVQASAARVADDLFGGGGWRPEDLAALSDLLGRLGAVGLPAADPDPAAD